MIGDQTSAARMARTIIAAATLTETEVLAFRNLAQAELLRAGADLVLAVQLAERLSATTSDLAGKVAGFAPEARAADEAMTAYMDALTGTTENEGV